MKLLQYTASVTVILLAFGTGYYVRGLSLTPKPSVNAAPAPAVSKAPASAADPKPYRTTLEGSVICLTQKDASSLQNMDCIYGLQTGDGITYGLDMNLLEISAPQFKAGDRVKAAGTVTPLQYLNTDQWQKYNIQGIFSVTDSFVVL